MLIGTIGLIYMQTHMSLPISNYNDVILHRSRVRHIFVCYCSGGKLLLKIDWFTLSGWFVLFPSSIIGKRKQIHACVRKFVLKTKK